MAAHIEMARDLSRPLMNATRSRGRKRSSATATKRPAPTLKGILATNPKQPHLKKWMLYREQLGQCACSQQALDIQRVLDDPNYAQVDHAPALLRSYDDSKNNKVLVHTREPEQGQPHCI